MVTQLPAPLLELAGLRIEAGSAQKWSEIVHGIDLTLGRGEVVGLIGESGAGKSTIGLAAMAFVRQGCRFSGGKILFAGQNLLEITEEGRRKIRGSRIAYVAQSASAAYNPARRLVDQCVEAAVQHGQLGRKEAVTKLVNLFGLMGLPDPDRIGQRFPHQLSGGQLQRIMTAMAMLPQPDLIIFDEPTTALDVTTQIEVLCAIQRAIRISNTAAIYISHDIAVVSQLADRMVVLRHGNIVEQGPTEDLLSNPTHPYVRALLESQGRAKQRDRRTSVELPLLCLESVSVMLGSKSILSDIDLALAHGRTLAIVGESGSGKSTLARTIAGLQPPLDGRILWHGRRLGPSYKGRSKDELQRIQLIHQSPDAALNPTHRVHEILARPVKLFTGRSGQELEKRVRSLLQFVELEPKAFLDRFPGELSGGQKQRICIARALAAEPELIICDEITSALDVLVAENILALLARLQNELGLTYMVITHDIGVVRAIADDIAVLQEGRIVERGPARDVLMSPSHPYTKKLLSSVPELRTGWLEGIVAERCQT